MQIFQKGVFLTLLLTLLTASVQGQSDVTTYNEPIEEPTGSAYEQSSQTAHWSVYVPITILVAAAIWFGVSDQSHKHPDYSDSQDGLGSIDSSKRHSSWRSYSKYSSDSYGNSGNIFNAKRGYRNSYRGQSNAGFSH